jgi:hypothetical protein
MNEDFYIEFVFFIKKKNKNVKLIWNKNKGFTDNELIELFGLDDDETIRVQTEILGAELYGDISQKYKEYFKNNYSIEDYYYLFATYQYEDIRSTKENLFLDIEISYYCQVGYKDVFNCFVTDNTNHIYCINDIEFLNFEKDNCYRAEIAQRIDEILNLKDLDKIRKELLYEKIIILNDKKRGGFFYFYDRSELFQDSYCPWDDISNYDYE